LLYVVCLNHFIISARPIVIVSSSALHELVGSLCDLNGNDFLLSHVGSFSRKDYVTNPIASDYSHSRMRLDTRAEFNCTDEREQFEIVCA
jgi:hypothetical protein